MCKRLFQFLELSRRAVHFHAGEIGHGEQLREQSANVIEMCENAVGAFVRFAAENFVAVNAEPVKETIFLSCGFFHKAREPGFDRLQFSGMHFEIRVNTDEV